MGKKSEYIRKIEERVYEQLLCLRYQMETQNLQFPMLNLEFALKTFSCGKEVNLLAETDLATLFRSLLKNLITLVNLEEKKDVRLILMDVYEAYLVSVDKTGAIR